jgi:hypothetical protein
MNKEKFLNKTVAIFVLSILLALAIGVGIGLGISHEGHDRGERGNEFSGMNENGSYGQMMNNQYVDDNNQNPNDAEVQDDQATTTASTTQIKK